MTKRWSPKRTVTLRRIRVMTCVVALVLASCLTFALTARKSVALDVNGDTRYLTTYATTVSGLLREQHVDVKTHDVVKNTGGGTLVDNDVVTVKSAYQTTITIDGQQMPFWTVAESADQLLDFFEQNEVAASRVRVDITNVYNQLTGGMVINTDGPVTVIADGKTSVAPNGKLPAASILDAKGITLGKDDRVSVQKEDGKTILRVQRVTYGDETQTVVIPYTTRTVQDDSLEPGTSRVSMAGENGEKQITYRVTYVDGVPETKTKTDEVVTKAALDEVVTVGPEKVEVPSDGDGGNGGGDDDGTKDGADDGTGAGADTPGEQPSDGPSDEPTHEPTAEPTQAPEPTQTPTQEPEPTQTPTQTPTQQPKPTQQPTQQPKPTQQPTQQPKPTQQPTQQPQQPSAPAENCRLCRPSAAAAQAYAAGAAAQYGWTGQNWSDLVKLWNRESGWRWNAENPYSGAYGIPQSLPGNKMAAFGSNWKHDAAVQIDWGLSYISGCYGSPMKAWEHSERVGWY